MSVKQISIFVENKPGALLAMTTVLAENRIDMRAFTLAETSDFGIVRIIVDDVYKTCQVLKDMGFVYSISSVLGVVIPNVPGGLNQVLQILTVCLPCLFVGSDYKTHGAARSAYFVLYSSRNLLLLW